MSDAIRLTVSDESPISLAVGEADPVARREIAELQGDVAELQEDVTTLQGNVTTLQGDVDTLDGAVTTLQGDMSSVQEDVTELQGDVADIETQLDNAVQPDAYSPNLTSGAALSLTSPTATESTWAQRATDAVDGVAVVDAVLGNTVVWNQMRQATSGSNTQVHDGITWTKNNDGSVNVSGTATASGYLSFVTTDLKQNHKYLIRGCSPSGGSSSTYCAKIGSTVIDIGTGGIYLKTTADSSAALSFNYANGTTIPQTTLWPQLFDLTRMFGAGNEPSTVTEFEALFPEPYYPYDAGSLLSVQMEGIETVGFNQWDEEWEVGGISTATGAKKTASNCIRSKNYIPVFPETEYRFTSNATLYVFYYDGALNFISWNSANNGVKTLPANCHYILFQCVPSYGTTYNHDICINLSDPARNGEYEPYHHFQRTIPAATYFPNGMRSAGSVHDELTSDAAIVRVGSVDLGTLDWYKQTSEQDVYFVFSGNLIADIAPSATATSPANIKCEKYHTSPSTGLIASGDKGIARNAFGYGSGGSLYIYDTDYTEPAAIKAALNGVMLYYALATPTTQPIDPPLTLTYRVEQGGTESVTHTDPTAAPTWRIRYPLDLAATVMANIAPVEQPVATANHAIGDLLCIGWQLYKVTSAIATGEAITQGTNVTPTTVAAEIAAIQ